MVHYEIHVYYLRNSSFFCHAFSRFARSLSGFRKPHTIRRRIPYTCIMNTPTYCVRLTKSGKTPCELRKHGKKTLHEYRKLKLGLVKRYKNSKLGLSRWQQKPNLENIFLSRKTNTWHLEFHGEIKRRLFLVLHFEKKWDQGKSRLWISWPPRTTFVLISSFNFSANYHSPFSERSKALSHELDWAFDDIKE